MVEQTPPQNVTILGAGPAGLCAGVALSREGVSVEIFERSERVGGLSRTEQRDGFRFDLGGHRFFTKKDELNAFLDGLMADELLCVPRVSHIYSDGTRYAYPLNALDVIRNLGPIRLAKAGASYVSSQLRHHLTRPNVVTFEDWVRWKFGNELYELFFRSYTEKVWGIPCTEISAEWAAQRIRGLDLGRAALNALGLGGTDGPTTLIERFRYPRDGYGRISERMADAIVAEGGQVQLGCPVQRLGHDGTRITHVEVGGASGVRQRGVTELISSIPLNLLVRMLDPAPTQNVLEAAAALRFRSLIVVHLRLKQERVSEDTWTYVQDARCQMGRFHEPLNWSPAMVTVPGHTSLVCEFFCTAGDTLWQREDSDLAELAVRELSDTLQLIASENVVGADVVKVPYAYPVFFLGYEKSLNVVRESLERFANLHLVGRGGMYRYHNVDHVLETGLLSARNVLARRRQYDVFAVNADQSYHEVVSDQDERRVGGGE